LIILTINSEPDALHRLDDTEKGCSNVQLR